MGRLEDNLVVLKEPSPEFGGRGQRPRSEQSFRLNKSGDTTIGREPSLVDIVLPFQTVSRVQARIFQEEQSYLLENLSQHVLMAVDDAQLRKGERSPLRHRARIKVGGYLLELQVQPKIPRYELLDELGRGGMGVVYKGRHVKSDRIVAIKMILSEREASFREYARFRIEAEALACLNHPNIVKIHSVGIFDDYPYLVIEYAERGSLANRINQHPQDPRWSAAIVGTLARAMQHAHERNILHRDLKPANVLLMADDTPVITDFGLVKFAISDAVDSSTVLGRKLRTWKLDSILFTRPHEDEVAWWDDEDDLERLLKSAWHYYAAKTGLFEGECGLAAVQESLAEVKHRNRPRHAMGLADLPDLTQHGMVMGSPQYMAPEQARADAASISPRTDVYGLGGILFALLTGRPPYTDGHLDDLLRRICSEPPSSPRDLVPDVPSELEAICLKCLEKEPDLRYDSAGALATDLERFLMEVSPLVLSDTDEAKSGKRNAKDAGPPLVGTTVTFVAKAKGWLKARWISFRR